jgi:hypothetical protein
MKCLMIPFLAVLLLGGCATVDTSYVGNHHMVSIKNTGWKLFNLIPLASGDIERPNSAATLLFQDSSNLDNNIRILDHAVEKAGATGFKNLSSTIREENVLFILLNRRIYHTSAELVFEERPADHPSNLPPCR